MVELSVWDRVAGGSSPLTLTSRITGCSAAVARSLGVREVASSILAIPTLRSLDAVPVQCDRTKRAQPYMPTCDSRGGEELFRVAL